MAEQHTTVPGNEGGNQGTQWFAGFDDENKGFVTSKGWDKLDASQALSEAIKGYRGAESKLGVPADQILKLPGKDAKPEDWRPVWQRLGAPEKPEGYELPVPDGSDPGFAKTASTWFHELGIPKSAAATLATKWNEHIAGMETAQTEAWNKRFDEELTALKGEWKGDDFAKNSDLAKRVMKTMGFSAEQLSAIERALGPKAFLQGFAKFGSMVGEHRFVGDGSQQFGMGPEQAKAKIADLQKDSQWMASYLTGDAAKKEEWTRLHQLAFGTELANPLVL